MKVLYTEQLANEVRSILGVNNRVWVNADSGIVYAELLEENDFERFVEAYKSNSVGFEQFDWDKIPNTTGLNGILTSRNSLEKYDLVISGIANTGVSRINMPYTDRIPEESKQEIMRVLILVCEDLGLTLEDLEDSVFLEEIQHGVVRFKVACFDLETALVISEKIKEFCSEDWLEESLEVGNSDVEIDSSEKESGETCTESALFYVTGYVL